MISSHVSKTLSFLCGTRAETDFIFDEFERDQNVELPKEIWKLWLAFSRSHLGYLSVVTGVLEDEFIERRKCLQPGTRLVFDEEELYNIIWSRKTVQKLIKWRTTMPLPAIVEVKESVDAADTTDGIKNLSHGENVHQVKSFYPHSPLIFRPPDKSL